MVLSWLLLLVMALPTVMTGMKMCIFCDLTDSSSNCPGILMTCGNEEQCFTGQGMILGLGPVTNKGCMLSTSCSRRIEPVIYQGVTYKFNSTCCDGELCNRAPNPAGSLMAGAQLPGAGSAADASVTVTSMEGRTWDWSQGSTAPCGLCPSPFPY